MKKSTVAIIASILVVFTFGGFTAGYILGEGDGKAQGEKTGIAKIRAELRTAESLTGIAEKAAKQIN